VEESAHIQIPEGDLVLRDAPYGLRMPGQEAPFSLSTTAFRLQPNYPNPFNSSTAICTVATLARGNVPPAGRRAASDPQIGLGAIASRGHQGR